MDIDKAFNKFIANEIPLYFVVGFDEGVEGLSWQSFIKGDAGGDTTEILAWREENASKRYVVSTGEFSDQLKVVPLLRDEFYRVLGRDLAKTTLKPY